MTSVPAPAADVRPMKILMVLTFYYPHWTGLTAYARRLAEGLARRGHRVTVLASRHDPGLAREEIHNGVRIVRLPVLFRLSRGVVMPGFAPALWRLMKDADVVQIHTPLLEAPLVTFFGRLLRRPVVFTHHGDLVMPEGTFNRIVERIVTALMTWALRMATRITVHSGDYARNSSFLSPFLHKLDAIYPPSDLPAPDRGAVAAWRRDLGMEKRPLVGFAGRWVEEKGFDYLLQAIPGVRESLPEAHFVYAGEPNVQYEDFFRKCAPYLEPVRSHVTMLGLITDPSRLANFYALSDVFALSSRTDCFPSTQVEAVLSGTPLVTTDIPGAREVVQVTGMGVLVPPRDPAGLARGIVEVLENRNRYVRPPAEIHGIFDMEKSVGEYEALLSRLRGGGGAGSSPRPGA
jgi:glycosyltransferase involved in cell wall biosynthesis